jgi:Na+/H+ antiporter NhaD/arsenite permease-like protein
MTSLVTLIFVLTYLGMALGRIPGLKIDRSGIALIAAVILVAAQAIPADEIAAAIHFPTLLLMGSLMILSARVGSAGVYEWAAAWIARQAGQPMRLLGLTIGIGGALSALLVNDIVVFAMTPLLCAGLAARKLDPRPFLFALAAANNVGSAANADRQPAKHSDRPGGPARVLVVLRNRDRPDHYRTRHRVHGHQCDMAFEAGR